MSSTISAPAFQAGVTANVVGGESTQAIRAPLSDSAGYTFTVGSSSGQVNKEYTATIAVNTSSATALDLTSLTNPLGESLTFAQVGVLKITNKSTVSGQDITVGGGTNPLLTTLSPVLKAGTGETTVLIATPITVDSTHKILTLAAAAGAAVSVTVTILGN